MNKNRIQDVVEVIKKERYIKPNEILRLFQAVLVAEDTLEKDSQTAESILDTIDKMADAKWLKMRGTDSFEKIYNAATNLTNEEAIQAIYDAQANRQGNVLVSPKWLVDKCFAYINEDIKTALICDCDLYDSSLFEKIKSCAYVNFTLTVRDVQYVEVYKILYSGLKNVEVICSDAFDDDFSDKAFDFISCTTLNHREVRPRKTENRRIPCEIGVIENLAKHSSQGGKAIFVTSSKFVYGTTRVEKNLRDTLAKKFNVLEAGVIPGAFLTGLGDKDTFIFILSKNIEAKKTKLIAYKTDGNDGNTYHIQHEKVVSQAVFSEEFEWNIPKVLILDDPSVKKLYESNVPKASLKDVTLDIFAGRNTKATTSEGKVKFVNISDIEDGKIDYANLDGLDEYSRKLKPYVLHTGDVLLTTKGTTIKTAVFKEQSIDCIPSANITVIRPNDMILGEYLRLFLESRVGRKLLQSLVRGGWLLNISRKDLETIDVPVPDLRVQKELVEKYNGGFETYEETISSAKQLWQKTKEEIENNLF